MRCVTALLLAALAASVVLPAAAVCPPRVRRAYSTLPCNERMLYARAVRELKRKHGSDYNDMVTAHLHNAAYAHGTTAFLPWHRYFLAGYENALRSLGGEFACVTIPYWDWEMDAGDERNSPVFQSSTFGAVGDIASGTGPQCVTSGIAARQGGWRDRTGACLSRRFINLAFSGEATVSEIITDNPTYAAFRNLLEGYPHAAPHVMVNGQMSTMASPEDPLFFMHHANVDRIWALWQDYHGYSRLSKAAHTNRHYLAQLDNARQAAAANPPVTLASLGIDAPMRFAGPDGRMPRWTPRAVTPREMMLINAMPAGSSYTYGPDGLAHLIGDTATGDKKWRWAVSADLAPVTCPQHDAKVPKPAAGRGADTLARGVRRSTEIVRKVKAAVRQYKASGKSTKEVFKAAARLECRLLKQGARRQNTRVPDWWLRMMGKPPAAFRKYYKMCRA